MTLDFHITRSTLVTWKYSKLELSAGVQRKVPDCCVAKNDGDFSRRTYRKAMQQSLNSYSLKHKLLSLTTRNFGTFPRWVPLEKHKQQQAVSNTLRKKPSAKQFTINCRTRKSKTSKRYSYAKYIADLKLQQRFRSIEWNRASHNILSLKSLVWGDNQSFRATHLGLLDVTNSASSKLTQFPERWCRIVADYCDHSWNLVLTGVKSAICW